MGDNERHGKGTAADLLRDAEAGLKLRAFEKLCADGDFGKVEAEWNGRGWKVSVRPGMEGSPSEMFAVSPSLEECIDTLIMGWSMLCERSGEGTPR